MNDSVQARTAVIDACLWMVREGLTFGTWGNISLRLDDDRMLITPSKVPYEEMKPEDLIVMGLNGDILSGSRLPTSERELHRGILASRPDIRAIIHTIPPARWVCQPWMAASRLSRKRCVSSSAALSP